MHHLVGACQCAHRLTKKRAYLEQARDLVAVLKRADAPSDGAQQLTPREREIAQLVARGYSNKAIAARLNISTRTVEGHVAAIFDRLAVRARWQLTPDLVAGARRGWG